MGEALSLTLTYAAGLPSGELDIRTRRLRQGGSVGVWEVELLAAGSDQVGVHAIVTMARRPNTPDFAFAKMPAAPAPGEPAEPGDAERRRAALRRRRLRAAPLEGFPPTPSGDSRSLAWVRSRRGPLDKALLGMITDNSAPRAMYALGPTIMTTTLSLTAYLHATVEDLAEVGDDFILVECEGRVGGGGASDERSSYWRRDGKLLATSEQLAWYREAAARARRSSRQAPRRPPRPARRGGDVAGEAVSTYRVTCDRHTIDIRRLEACSCV